jgi:1-acyl-sn-glycerol-3-phosphate acyltransferase
MSPQVSIPRALWRLACCGFQIVLCLGKCAFLFPRLSPPEHREEVRLFSRRILKSLGVHLTTQGPLQSAPVMRVANHISWLDIMAINTVAPAYFIAKAEVRRWPLLGWMVAGGGTLFLERERKRDAMRMVAQVADQLQAGHPIAVFPEGTTSDGHSLLPFYPNLLQAAVVAQVPAQALALRYADPQHPISPAPAYVGDTTLLRSVWSVARAHKLAVHITLLPAVHPAAHTRHTLSAHLCAQIAGVLEEGGGVV